MELNGGDNWRTRKIDRRAILLRYWWNMYGYQDLTELSGCDVGAKGGREELKGILNIGDIGRAVNSGVACKRTSYCRSPRLHSDSHNQHIQFAMFAQPDTLAQTDNAKIHTMPCHANLPDHLPPLHNTVP
jgi:hypothetical protein